ncbi:hypothetical protein BGZ70_003027 [Mortierella alpina]|uniref:C2H2-type domain-containing protein n=1 Tax=Mortierella alpina TaxID=64518 RepID=A0A9P6LVK5_MORAP|nr:hypothetical protein BGZ70_003027 [Mortierella alpina]
MTHSHSQQHHHPQQQGFAADAQFFVPHAFPLGQAQNGLPISYLANHPTHNNTNTNNHNSDTSNSNSTPHYTYQVPVHPFQMTASQNSPDTSLASPSRVRYGFPTSDPLPFQPTVHPMAPMTSTSAPAATQDMDDVQANASISHSPSSSSLDGSSPTFQGPFGSPFALRSAGRVHSLPFTDHHLSRFELQDDYMDCAFPRHGSLGSLCLDTQSLELLEASLPTMNAGGPHYPYPHHPSPHHPLELAGTAMAPSLSSSSISSESSLPSPNDVSSKQTCVTSNGGKPKLRRASTALDSPGRMFTCIYDDCGKLFKRSEHLKRHVRSVHTLEKPYICPVDSCPKRFSRSDNLNQHIRVHRPEKERSNSKQPFSSFTPFL